MQIVQLVAAVIMSFQKFGYKNKKPYRMKSMTASLIIHRKA